MEQLSREKNIIEHDKEILSKRIKESETSQEKDGNQEELLKVAKYEHLLEIETLKSDFSKKMSTQKELIQKLQNENNNLRENLQIEEMKTISNKELLQVLEEEVKIMKNQVQVAKDECHAWKLEAQGCKCPEHSVDTSETYAQKVAKSLETYNFHGDKEILSNFYPCEVKAFGVVGKSVEALYQHAKAMHHNEFKMAEDILGMTNAYKVKTESKKIKQDNHWHMKKIQIMRHLITQKLEQVPEFKHALLRTGSQKLIHDVEDQYWGIDKTGSGGNKFGDLLTEFRGLLNALPQLNDTVLNTESSTYCGDYQRIPVEDRKNTEQVDSGGNVSLEQGRGQEQDYKLLIVGNSQTHRITTRILGHSQAVVKYYKYKISEARDFIQEASIHAECICYHLITNDVKYNSWKECAHQMEQLIAETKKKMPNTKIVISLAVPRGDNEIFDQRAHNVNNILQDLYSNDHMVHLTKLSHKLRYSNGDINGHFYQRDGVHLNKQGTSILAWQMRQAVAAAITPESGHYDVDDRASLHFHQDCSYIQD